MGRPSYVWIVEIGEDYEGANILGVYASRGLALTSISDLLSEGTYVLDGGEEDSWHHGCSYLTIERHVVVFDYGDAPGPTPG